MILTGSDGFIGKHLTHRLKQLEIEVFNLSLHAISQGKVTLEQVQRDPKRYFNQDSVLVHLAAAGVSNRHSPDAYEINYLKSALLVQLAVSENVRKIVSTGTGYEYLRFHTAMSEEGNPEYGRDEYARSKSLFSDFLANSGAFPFSHFRLFQVFGFGSQPQRLDAQIRLSMETGEPIRLTSPDSVRDFTHICDVTSFILREINQEHGTGVIDFSTGEGNRVSDFVNMILNSSDRECQSKIIVPAGPTIPSRKQPDYVGIPPDFVLENKLAKKLSEFSADELISSLYKCRCLS